MEGDTIKVNLGLKETAQLLDKGIVRGSITGVRLDYHSVKIDEIHAVIVIVYEKHYYRAGNRLTLTVTIDNIDDVTRVHSIGAGGGEGFFRFDWGAASSFTNAPRTLLKNYII